MITKQKMYDGKSVVELVCKIHEQLPVPPKNINNTIPEDLQKICLKAVEKKQENRYQSAGALADDIIRVTNGEPIEKNFDFRQVLFKSILYYKKSILILLLTLAVLSFSWTNHKQQMRDKNYPQIYSLYTQGMEILSSSTIQNITWDYDVTNKNDIDKVMLIYIEADNYFSQAYALDTNYDFVNHKITKIYNNICILSTLTKNYTLAEFYLQRYREINIQKSQEIALKIYEYQNKIKQQHEQEIQKIIVSLSKEPEEGAIDEYVFRAAKLKSEHTTKMLLQHLNTTPTKWQRIFIIKTLGELGDTSTTYSEENSGELLTKYLAQLQIPQDVYEIKVTIWSLGKLRYEKALDNINQIRDQLSPQSILYQQIQIPYEWLQH